VAATQVHLELLLGRKVLDPSGRVVGRVEEVRAHIAGDHCFVDEYHLGPAAWLERLSARVLSRKRGRRVPWEKLELADPEHPRLLCSVEDLERAKS
jgi:sporulation protein YlmC with PRC-barrel domain